MNPSVELPILLRLLDEELRLLRGFLDLLNEEQQHLVSGAVDALLATAERKTQIYHQLQRIHDDRAARLQRLGLKDDDEGVRTVFQAVPSGIPRWEQVLELAREAREANARNGKLIAVRMQHNQGALSILMAAVERPQLYGPDGQARFGGRGRHLGSV